jgi:hypothetical protein
VSRWKRPFHAHCSEMFRCADICASRSPPNSGLLLKDVSIANIKGADDPEIATMALEVPGDAIKSPFGGN